MEKTVIERNYCYVNQLKNYSTLFGVDRMMKSIKLRLQRHQAKLVTRGAHHRFGRVNIIADKEKDNVTIDN